MPRQRKEVQLPAGTVDLHSEVVPAVRALLRKGLSEQFLRSCVRISGYEPFAGGFKSQLVGGLRIDVRAALKLGDRELELTSDLVACVNRLRPRTFAGVQALVDLGDSRRLAFMEELTGYETLLDRTYRRSTTRRDLSRILAKVFAGARAIGRAGRQTQNDLRGLPTNRLVYVPRLRERFEKTLREDRGLRAIRTRQTVAAGESLPPLDHVLAEAERWERDVLAETPRVLAHGDLHLGNIMTRRRGRGFSVRLIDPNPMVGFTDAMFDAGKLLHWAEPVGWAVVAPEACSAPLAEMRDSVRLDPLIAGVSGRAEQRRTWVEADIRRLLERMAWPDPAQTARIELSVAAAHVGLAALLSGPERTGPRRLALAYALRALARWWRCAARPRPTSV